MKPLNLVVVGVITAVSVVADVAVDVVVGVVTDFVGATVFIGVVVVDFKED